MKKAFIIILLLVFSSFSFANDLVISDKDNSILGACNGSCEVKGKNVFDVDLDGNERTRFAGINFDFHIELFEGEIPKDIDQGGYFLIEGKITKTK